MGTGKGLAALSTAEAAEYTGISENTLRYWRHVGQGPKSFKLGRKLVKYLVTDLDAWVADQYEGSVTA